MENRLTVLISLSTLPYLRRAPARTSWILAFQRSRSNIIVLCSSFTIKDKKSIFKTILITFLNLRYFLGDSLQDPGKLLSSILTKGYFHFVCRLYIIVSLFYIFSIYEILMKIKSLM